MADILDLRSSSSTLDMSIPSNSILPLLASTNLNKAAASDDLPVNITYIHSYLFLAVGNPEIPVGEGANPKRPLFLAKISFKKLHEVKEIWAS